MKGEEIYKIILIKGRDFFRDSNFNLNFLPPPPLLIETFYLPPPLLILSELSLKFIFKENYMTSIQKIFFF